MKTKKMKRARFYQTYQFSELRNALTLKEFEPNGKCDYLAIPYHLLRWLFAWLYTEIYFLKWRFIWRFFPDNNTYLGGRRYDPFPTICPRCMWAGMYRWLYHGYQGEDSEPVSECPKCGKNL